MSPLKNKKKNPESPETEKVRYGDLAIRENHLEKWPAPPDGTPMEIRISFPEFTCLCPRSGYPDFATIHVRYRPSELIVELKSLKLYLNSFRTSHISHEESASIIYKDLMNLLKPNFLEVIADFNVRGNVKTVITLHSGMGKTPEKDKET